MDHCSIRFVFLANRVRSALADRQNSRLAGVPSSQGRRNKANRRIDTFKPNPVFRELITRESLKEMEKTESSVPILGHNGTLPGNFRDRTGLLFILTEKMEALEAARGRLIKVRIC